MKAQVINIGIIGMGTVGSGVWEILRRHRELLLHRVGARLEIKKIAVRSPAKKRPGNIPRALLTKSPEEILADPSIQVVVELMGGVSEARKYAKAALAAGKHVVTANKALLAEHGAELFAAARKAGVDICFEASVCGGIPILRSLREGFVGDRIDSLFGIVNGTCNYILTEMAEQGGAFADVLKAAQGLGYAEADPRFDVDGIDAAHKLAILMAIAHGISVDWKSIFVEGIRSLSPLDFEFARRFGQEIRLLAIMKTGAKGLQARVHPTMIPAGSMLAAVKGVYNAVLVHGAFVGEGMLYGRGAGSGPTAVSVVGDIVEVARNILARVAYTVPPLGIHDATMHRAKIEPMGDLVTPYYLRFTATDRPGVLAKIASTLSGKGISISSVYQHGQGAGGEVPIVVLTHASREKDVQAAIQKINRLPAIRKKTAVIRIEESFR